MIIIAISVFAFIYLATSIKFENGQFSVLFLSFSKIYIYLIYIALSIFAFAIGSGKPARSLVVFSIINAGLIITAIFAEGSLAMWSILGSGLFFSIGWSNIFSLAIKDLGKYTSQGSSLLVMAIVGGAALPWVQSHIIESFDVKTSFIIPLIGLLYIIFYGLNGYKISKKY
jgi:FHS family L-fucose permease-like MFS transporter